jgi:chromate reductase
MMVFLNMFPINKPEVMIGNSADKFDAHGKLTDEQTREFIAKLLRSLVDWTSRIAPRESLAGGASNRPS